jgi:hypothetical protein
MEWMRRLWETVGITPPYDETIDATLLNAEYNAIVGEHLAVDYWRGVVLPHRVCGGKRLKVRLVRSIPYAAFRTTHSVTVCVTCSQPAGQALRLARAVVRSAAVPALT